VQKSAEDTNLKRTPHRPTSFIASNAWGHEHRFVVGPSSFWVRATLDTTCKQVCSQSSSETVHESRATSYVQFDRECVCHHPPPIHPYHGAASQYTARLMPFTLVVAADPVHVGRGGHKAWRRPKDENRLPKVVRGVTFTNGVEVTDTPAQSAARSRRHPVLRVACERLLTSAEWAQQRTTAAGGEARLWQLHLKRGQARAFVATRASSVCFLRAQRA